MSSPDVAAPARGTSALRRPTPGRRLATGVVLVAVGAMAATACSDEGGDAERFCGEIEADVAAVVAPDLSTVAGLDAALAHYRRLADLAPAAVEPDWVVLVTNLETASTVVPDDEASVQRAVTQAYASEGAAVRVRDWLLTNCGVDLGPVTTIAPQAPVTPRLEPAPGETTPGDGSGATSD